MKKSLMARGMVAVAALVLVFSALAFADTVEPTEWVSAAGTWEIQVVNEDESSNNTNAYAEVEQRGELIRYEWSVLFQSTTFSLGPAAGMHIMADHPTDAVRGNSYLVFQDAEYIRLYKAAFGSLSKVDEFPIVAELGHTHDYRVDFNTDTGLMQIYRNGELVGEWTDTAPLESGKYISLRTNGTKAAFHGVKVTTDPQ